MADGYYFNYLPTIPYETFDGSGEYKVVTDIFKRCRATLQAREDRALYYKYQVKDKETPEIISYKYYGQSQYYWVITLMNQMRDPQWSWPLEERVFEKYIVSKYGSVEAATQETSHYETVEIKALENDDNYSRGDIVLASGTVTNSTFLYSYTSYQNGVPDTEHSYGLPASRKEFTMYEKETRDNENKRNIILLRRNLLQEFVDEFENLITKRT